MKKIKNILWFIITLIIISLILILILKFGARNSKKLSYSDTLFDNSYVHTIDVIIKDDDWNDLLSNPTLKTNYKVDVIIDNNKVNNVSFRTKGNSSLNRIAAVEGSTRYSFKLDFGKYILGQTYDGLEELHLNNIYADSTYLKDYVSYELFREMNVPTPLISFIFVKINGQDHGLYIAIEDIGDSFLTRNNLSGNLYKPEMTMGIDNGASLTYRDGNINSYADIFDNAITKINNNNKLELINGLKKMSLGNYEYLNIDEIIRYFVAHNYLLSYDSYTGPSIHNYYLYQDDSLSIIPWDYNMAFGGFGMKNDSTYVINFGIDTPLYNIAENKRPLWNVIATSDEYLDEYHKMMNNLLEDYFENGEFYELIDTTYKLIKSYIEKDPTAFYNVDKVNRGVETLKEFNKLRVASIRKQLQKELSTFTDLQLDEDRVDTSSIALENMGIVTGENSNGNRP